jgi:BTB/POZ domain
MVDIYVGPESTHWPLHEGLLCYHSPFFASIFYDKKANSRTGQNKSYGLPDEDDLPFELLVGWLYSRSTRPPREEKDIGPLLDLYLLADKFEMEKLCSEVVDAVREFYHSTSTYPGLRRVQYIYSNTSEDDMMREMMVSSIARYLTLADAIPKHWANALRKNGQLAVDIIRAIQEWHLESRSVPDVRDASVDRGRTTKGFSVVEDDRKRGHENAETGATDESMNQSFEHSDVPAAAVENGVNGEEKE